MMVATAIHTAHQRFSIDTPSSASLSVLIPWSASSLRRRTWTRSSYFYEEGSHHPGIISTWFILVSE